MQAAAAGKTASVRAVYLMEILSTGRSIRTLRAMRTAAATTERGKNGWSKRAVPREVDRPFLLEKQKKCFINAADVLYL